MIDAPALPAKPIAPMHIGMRARLIWLALGSCALAEMAARARPDAVVLDLQHGLWERNTLESAIGLVAAHVPAIVRSTDFSATAIGAALDAGASSVLAPLVETAEDARAIVQGGRYPPRGRRSCGGVRPLTSGAAGMREADRRIALGARVETVRGVDNVDAICAVDGIDYVFVGTGDLALSLGDTASEELSARCAQVRDAAHRHGRPCGLFTPDARSARDALAIGYDLVVVCNDIDLGLQGFARALEAAAGQPQP